MEHGVNEEGFAEGLETQFDEAKYCPQAVRFNEYLLYEEMIAEKEGNEAEQMLLDRIRAFVAAKGLNTIIKNLPVKALSLSKQIKSLPQDQQEDVKKMISSLISDKKD